MELGKNILKDFTKRWRFFLALEVFLYAIGAAVLVYSFNGHLLFSLLTFIATLLLTFIFIKPWKPTLKDSSSYFDNNLESVEYSSALFLSSSKNLTPIAKLQREKILEDFQTSSGNLRPPHNLLRGGISAGFLILMAFFVYQFNLASYFDLPKQTSDIENNISFQPVDSLEVNSIPPKIESQSLTINYPNYTNIKTRRFNNMSIKAVEGSSVTWELSFNIQVDSVFMESMGSSYFMNKRNGIHIRSSILKNSGFYSFRFLDNQGQSHASDLYAIEVLKDNAPSIEIKGLKQFTSFDYDDSKVIDFTTEIVDDYGIADAFIIATVSKGSGESVKFREEKLTFKKSISRGSKSQVLSKQIDLSALNMSPGDELYFYVEALDLKRPKANRARSETYFAVIKDTTSNSFGVEATLGVDRMPDYFRSQRQLIIDTEKLIAEKSQITIKEFKFRSNELGFDQKTLRLKYGEFMGVETEETGGSVNQESLESMEDEQHDDEEEHDPLEEYTHDHDGDNEHNLVEEKKEDGENSKNPLQDYTHTHEDSDMATLFEESLRSKLLRAMNEMWDAELYLRLYQPKKSLPYQYRALKLIQEIKNSARIYVHRIGFDPPPIKEDKRLTGKIEDVRTYSKRENLAENDDFLFMKEAILRLEILTTTPNYFSKKDQLLFESAGNELAKLAIEHPGKYLGTLQKLKQLTVFGNYSSQEFLEVQKGLLEAIPSVVPNAGKSNISTSEINQLLLKALESND